MSVQHAMQGGDAMQMKGEEVVSAVRPAALQGVIHDVALADGMVQLMQGADAGDIRLGLNIQGKNGDHGVGPVISL